MTLPSTPTLLAQQKANYQSIVGICKAVERCVGITVWDFTDKVCENQHHAIYPTDRTTVLVLLVSTLENL